MIPLLSVYDQKTTTIVETNDSKVRPNLLTTDAVRIARVLVWVPFYMTLEHQSSLRQPPIQLKKLATDH